MDRDSYRGIHHIFLYMDIVKYPIFGDTSTPLLRVIPMKAHAKENRRRVNSYIFSDPHCIRVSREYIESIAIHLMSDSGESLPISLG